MDKLSATGAATQAAGSPSAPAEIGRSGAPLSLLIVDDDPTHVTLIRRAFEMAGTNVEIRVAGTLREYRASVADRRPDLALLDLILPDGRGVEVLTQPLEAAPFPSVVMTAYGNQEIAVEIMKAGALDYVVKSVEALAMMPRTVERALREWALIQKHRQTELALQASEAKYRDLFANMAEEVHFWKLVRDAAGQIKTWQVVDANPPALKTWGRSSLAETIGKTADEIYPGATAHFMPVVQKIMRDGVPYSFEDYFPPPVDKYFRFTSVPLGEYFITTGADITRVKKIQAELIEAQRIAHIGSWYWDPQTDMTTGSDELFRLFGFDPRTETLPNFQDQKGKRYTVADWERMNAALQTALQTGVGYELELRAFRNDGTSIWTASHGEVVRNAAGQIVGLRGTVQDITDRKRAEEALQRSEALLREGQHLARLGNWEWNTVVDRHTWSPEIYAIYGRDPQLGPADIREVPKYFTPESWARLSAAVAHGRLNGAPYECDAEVVRPDGSHCWVIARGTVMCDASGTVTGLRGTVQDITERRRAEEAVRESEARLNFALQTIKTGAWELDLLNHTAYRTLIHDQIFGYATLLPRWTYEMFLEHILPEDRPEVDRKFREATVAQTNWNFECRIRRTDGAVRWIWAAGSHQRNAEGHPVRMAGIVQDITERKQAEMALRESEARLSVVFHKSPVGIVLNRVDDGRIMDVNAAFADIHGYTRAELVGRLAPEFNLWVNPADRVAMVQQLRVRGICKNQEIKTRTKTGEIRDVQISVELIELAGEQCMLSLAQDITERKRAEEAVRASQQFIEWIINAMPVRVFWKDTNLRFLGCNAAFARDVGFTEPQDVIGKDDFQVAGRDRAELYRTDDREVIASGCAKLLIEEPHTTPDGKTITLLTSKIPLRNSQGEITGVLGTYMDITDRKQAEEQVRRAKEEWERTFDAVPDLICLLDTQHTILRTNRAMAAKLGVTTAQAVGLTCYQHVHGTQCPPGFCPHAQLLLDQQEHTVEVHEDRLGGDFLVTCTPLRDADGHLIGSVHVARDITTRKQGEAQVQESNRQLGEALTALRQTQDQVIEQENLRVLGQMASGIAHDFNNALAPIIGFSELLLKHPEKLADQEQVLKRLQIINTCATDAARVVRQMGDFGRQHLRSDVFQPLDLTKLVRQTIDHTQPRWKDQVQATGHTIQIVTELLPVLPIDGEEFAIREMLTNLILNAVDALPTGGTITLGTMVDGQSVRVWVSDTGTGMTEEVRQRCLEPFFTTKGAKGIGLGLAMVQGIVQRHNGTIEIESQLGQGTTFTIRFPIAQDAKGPALPAAAAPLTRSLHVLVVDDEPQLRAVAEAWLIADGHTVETAGDGAAALARLTAGRFDVVITDKAMPGMNGEQLAATIAGSVPGLPVILMTGFGDLMQATGAMPSHIRAILSKPVTQASLRTALAKMVAPQLPAKR